MQGLLRSCRRLPRARRHVEALASWRCTSFACRWQHASAALDDNEAAAAGSAGPLALYEAAVSRGKYRSDPQQARVTRVPARTLCCFVALTRSTSLPTQLVAVHKLQRLWSEVAGGSAQSQLPSTSGLTLVDAMDEGTPARWKLWSLLTGGGSSEQPSSESALHVRGLYLYGGVGAGKTMLMDLFYDALPPGMRKKRVRCLATFVLDKTIDTPLPSLDTLPRLHARRPPSFEGAEGRGGPASRGGRGTKYASLVHINVFAIRMV